MRLRSRGLGRKELVLDFREYAVVRVDDETVVVGTIRDPVSWDFTIRLCEDDVVGTAALLLRWPMLSLLLRGLFKRRKRHHWNQERPEHVAEGRRRRQLLRENAEERARASVTPVAPRAVRGAAASRPPAEVPAAVPALERSSADGS
jgi:hypothetical protein